MFGYVSRRLLQAIVVLFAASYLVYVLAAYAGDPLETLRVSRDPNREAMIARRVDLLDLDVPPVIRYFGWVRGALGCLAPFATSCDLGSNIQGYEVTGLLAKAMVQTIQLVTAATVLAIVVGIALGIVSALRQYSSLDYGVTFMAFLFFSLPVFWVAVLLKEFGAIRFNDFLTDPRFSPPVVAVVALAVGAFVWFSSYGETSKRAVITAVTAVLTAATMVGVSASGWLLRPALGVPGVLVLGGAAAFVFTFLVSGLRNRQALYAGTAVVLIGAALYFPLQPLLNQMTWWLLLGLTVATVVVGVAVGWAFGGYDRGQVMRVATFSALATGFWIVVDRFMQAWPAYIDNGRIRGRPISTVGSRTPGFNEDWWLTGIDAVTHLFLPTTALMLIALAGYSRYSRASMLEVMNQDYIRTARAKGASERSVVMRHAFRNALIPLATLVAFDIGGLIGGAVITENVFAFTGMGQLFVQALNAIDLNTIMGVFLLTGLVAMVFNLVADLLYAVLDPRVRVKG